MSPNDAPLLKSFLCPSATAVQHFSEAVSNPQRIRCIIPPHSFVAGCSQVQGISNRYLIRALQKTRRRWTSYIKLHQATSSYIKLHQATSSYIKLHQATPFKGVKIPARQLQKHKTPDISRPSATSTTKAAVLVRHCPPLRGSVASQLEDSRPASPQGWGSLLESKGWNVVKWCSGWWFGTFFSHILGFWE